MISVLYVDDEKLLRDITRKYLDTQGFPIDTAESGAEALEKLKTGTYDAVVSDYEMPGMNGIALLKEVRIRYPELPFILFTGRGREEVVIEAFDCGADYYLQKGGKPAPQFTELIHKIKLAVEHRQTERELACKHEELSGAYEEIRATEEELRHNYDELASSQQELQKSERKFRDLFNNAILGIFRSTPDGHYLEMNPAFAHIAGYSSPEIMIEKVHNIQDLYVNPQDRERLKAMISRDGEIQNFETEIRRLDGFAVWIAINARIRKDKTGKIQSFDGTIEDITSRKTAEIELECRNVELRASHEQIAISDEELKKSEERLRFTLDATNDGIWDWNVPTGQAFFSPRWYTMLGYTPDEMPATYSTWRSLIHPDDIQTTDQTIQDHILKNNDAYVVEFRMQEKQGGWTWILARGKVIERDREGNPVRMVGTHTDITGLKGIQEDLQRKNEELVASYEELTATEEELRHQYDALMISEENLRKTSGYLDNLIAYANVPIIIWDPSFIITQINHAFEDLTGRKSEDIVGNSIDVLFPFDQKKKSMRLLETTQAGVHWNSVELEILHLDGSNRTVIWNSSTIYTPDGITPVATIAQGQDITLRRRLEKDHEASVIQIQKNLAQLSILNDEIRNPLMVILCSAEMSGEKEIFDMIEEQTNRIDAMVTQLDNRWVESEKILSMLRKNYHINAYPSDVIISKDSGPVNMFIPASPLDKELLSAQHRLLAEEVQAELFTILDSIDALVYVADLETYEMLYLNQMGRSLFGDIAGKKCFQVIQKNLTGQCSFCINPLLSKYDGLNKVHISEYQNSLNGRWYECRDRVIRWSDGRLVHLQIATDITERRAIVDALRESEYTSRKLFEESSDPILLMQNDRFIECNQATLTLLNIPDKAQFIGTNPDAISPEYQPDGRRSDEAASEYIAQAHQTGHCRFEWMCKRHDGTRFLLEVSLLQIQFKGEEMLHVTWRDVTQRRQMEQSLRESEELFRGLVNTITSGVAIYDVQGDGSSGSQYIIKDFNRMALEIEGKTRDEVVGKSLADLRPSIDEYGLIPVFQKVYKTGVPAYYPQKIYVDERYSNWYDNRVFKLQSGEIVAIYNDVTEQKRGEEALQKSEELLRTFIEKMPLPLVLLNNDRLITYANDRFIQTFGYTLLDIPTLTEWLALAYPDAGYREKVAAIWEADVKEAAEKKIDIQPREYTITCKDGTRRITLISGINVGENTLVTLIDITTLRQAEENNAKNRVLLSETEKLGKIGGWEFNPETYVQTWTEETFHILEIDLTHGEPKVPEGLDFIVSPYREMAEEAIGRAIRFGEPYDQEWEIITRKGNLRWVHAVANVRKDTDKVTSIYGSFQDITDRKRIEESLRQANIQLNLLSGITRHDINNNITVILTSLEIAKIKCIDPAMKEYLDIIDTATSAIQNQINFTKVFQDLGTHEPQWQNLMAVLSRSPVPDAWNLTIDGMDMDIEVYADPMFERVFFNLLDNSIRHGVRISEIRVSVKPSGEDLMIIWEDNGIGITPDEKERIFDRGVGKNTGLGLFLVREILSITGITIHETGEEGNGVRFEIQVSKGGYRHGTNSSREEDDLRE